MFVPALVLSAILLKPLSSSIGPLRDTPTAEEAAPPSIVPVPLPDPALSDDDYKTALAALLADGALRPGVSVSLLHYLPPPGSESRIPAHAAVIAQLMDPWLKSPNKLETLLPLRVVARCGAVAQPEWTKVLPLTDSILIRVRVAATEALGGLYVVGPGESPTAPPIVLHTLLKLAQTDSSPQVKMMAALALGHDRIATPEAITTLAALVGSTNNGTSLGALSAAERIGPDARPMIPAIQKCLTDPQRVNNAAPTLIAVAPPHETARILAETIIGSRDVTILSALTYYAGHLDYKAGDPEAQPLADAIKPLLGPFSALPALPEPPPPPVIIDETMPAPPPPSAEDKPAPPTPGELAALRISAARAYAALTGDLKTASAPLTELAADTRCAPDIRVSAINTIRSLGAAEGKDPAVIHTLVDALGDSDSGVQNAAVGVLFKFGGPAAAAAAPRLSAILLTAFQNKEEGRVYTLINAIYRIGPVAARSATPVLKQIRAGEPAGSANARFAEIALQRMTE